MRNDSGFAMADTLVALTLLALFVASLLSINSNSISATQKSHAKLGATLIAKALATDRSIRENKGEFVLDQRTFKWTKRVTPQQASTSSRVALNDISISVEWEISNKPYSYTIEAVHIQ